MKAAEVVLDWNEERDRDNTNQKNIILQSSYLRKKRCKSNRNDRQYFCLISINLDNDNFSIKRYEYSYGSLCRKNKDLVLKSNEVIRLKLHNRQGFNDDYETLKINISIYRNSSSSLGSLLYSKKGLIELIRECYPSILFAFLSKCVFFSSLYYDSYTFKWYILPGKSHKKRENVFWYPDSWSPL
jgi:hypothetical protein